MKIRFSFGDQGSGSKFGPIAVSFSKLFLVGALAAEGQAQFLYTTTNGAVTITKYTGPDGAVAVPGTIDGLPVTSIGSYAFFGLHGLTSITIPNSVTNIGDAAFSNCFWLTNVTIPKDVSGIGENVFTYCTHLGEITVDALNQFYCSVEGVLLNKSQTKLIQSPGGKAGIYIVPDSVTNIGDFAFVYCVGLTGITIGNSVTSIGWYAFDNCVGLTSVTIPDSVTSIGGYAFFSCGRLTNVTILDGVTNIGESAFDWCLNLTNVTIPKGVTSIGDFAFNGCTNLRAIKVDALNQSFSSVDGVLFDKSQTALIQYPGGKAGHYTVPNSVVSIGKGAFDNCTRLTSVTIPIGVASIGDLAFDWCLNLTSVAIPKSVASIGHGAFGNCASVSSIVVDASNQFYSSVDGVLFNKRQDTLIQYPGGKAGTYTVPNSVTGMGDYAFVRCLGLTSVTIGNRVFRMGSYAFSSCSNLASVTIPKSVDYIDSGAFQNCASLTSITIPESVKGIGDEAFRGCTRLKGVYFKGKAPGTSSYAFFNADQVILYYLPGTTGWSSTLGGRPTLLWNPAALTSDASFGVRAGRFGFTISGTSNLVIVAEACTNLTDPIWSPVGTNSLTGGSSYFSDPQWANYAARFYRLRSP